ncbi:MAG: DNA photolyase [Candidatus Desulfatibia sp.]|uniref:SPL family radical SAM protein n=1 Tax=Candidatus Desulfatibia sp. TaxID=3101189 RepID=UPI002F338D41
MTISKLYIDQHVANLPQVVSIQSRLNIPYEVVEDSQKVFEAVSCDNDPVLKGKKLLFLTSNRGAFIKDCPGTRAYTCCGYKILHIGTYCTMDCSYCILQAYFHPPVLQYFVNHDDLLKDLERLFLEKTVSRIGTGEFTDSMIWEAWTDLSSLLVSKFAGQSQAVLELKTKTTAIGKLEQLQHNRKTIVAWSLNTDRVIDNEERGTARLSARLRAAAKCESWGYPLAFHFDPLVIYDGCEDDYRQVVQQLFSQISSKNIVWISLGSFRFMPSLKPIIQRRFPGSKIVYGELISGLDGKMRYFKPLRIDLFRKMTTWIREMAPDVLIYFCMEDDEVWQKALGFIPAEGGGLPKMLDESAVRICGLNPLEGSGFRVQASGS